MELRSVLSSWRDLNAPYQAARVRVLMGEACRELGDDSGAALEFEAAWAGFEELGASVELEHVALLVEMRSRVPGGLSAREKEVLVLVAAGKTVMLVPDQRQALREMVRVTKPGGRVLLIAYGPPADLEFLQFFIGALRAVAPDFPGLPDDPPPLEFQVSDPKVLSRRLTNAGLKDVTVERTAERPAFRSGEEMWDWVMNGNPIPGMLIADLNDDQQTTLRKILDGMLRERYGENGLAVLTNVVNIGMGTK